jgi:hypothetical protein
MFILVQERNILWQAYNSPPHPPKDKYIYIYIYIERERERERERTENLETLTEYPS